jgi:hypothetical protein
MRSKLAKPLLTSLSAVTMLAASSFVLLAVSSTGSAKPWDWTRANPSAALSRYELCGRQGLGAIGCMLSASFHPAAAAEGASGDAHQSQQPLFSVATVADQAPAETPGTRPAAPAPGGAASTHRPNDTAGVQHLVKLPPNATMADVLAACRAAMTAAQTQGAATMKEVVTECEADLEPRCPAAMQPPTVQGAAAIQELESECRPPSPASPSPFPTRELDE